MRVNINNASRLMRPVVIVAVGLSLSTVGAAQGRDTTARPSVPPAARAAVNPLLVPPLTPRRAFFYALALPGSAQNILGRHRTAAGMLAMEMVSLAMIHESNANVREARLAEADTVIMSYVGSNGLALSAPTKSPGRFTGSYVRTRHAQVEDWIAVLVANHLFSGADAFVSAHLWDVKAQVGFRAAPQGLGVAAQFHW